VSGGRARPRAASEELTDLAEWVVGFALRCGADEAEAVVNDGFEFNVDVRKGRVEHLEEAGEKALRLRVIKDGRTAHAASSDLEPGVLRRLVRNAVTRARLSSPDEYAGLAPLSTTALPGPELDIYDPDMAGLAAAAKIKLALETERVALSDKRITNSHGATLTSAEGRLVIVNSNGFRGDYRQTYCSLGVGLQAGETDNRAEDYWFSAKRHFRDLDPPEAIARKAVARTVRHLNPRKLRTGNVPVIFEPTQTAWLLGFLFACVSGTAVYQKSTFLAGRLGRLIAHPRVTVVDDGLLPRGLGTRPFDSDGLPSQRTEVIKNGRLLNYLCNFYAARKLGLKSTANASGTGVGPTNFYLMPGPETPERMIVGTRRGLILTKTIGHGLNPVTGDISRGAFGLWVEGGEVTFPVAEVTISGNLGRMLKEVEAIGNDLDLTSAVTGPTVKFAEMTVAGR
jgi:PmbA protein